MEGVRRGRVRRREVPDRVVGDKVVLARPDVDEAIVLGGAAAAMWIELDDWTSLEVVEAALIDALPAPGALSWSELLDQTVAMLDGEGLLERDD